MSRIPTASRENVPQDQLAAFDELVASRGSVPEIGPVAIMINGPELASRGEHYRAYFRGEEITLPANVRELAMITTARELDCQFIWNAHSGYARQAGISDKLVDDLRDKKELTGLSDQESAVINYGREFFRTHKVSQATFDAAQAQFGTLGLVELTNLMGYYSALAFNINAFDVGLPDNLTELPLPI
ncbi:MAG: carboxymuconolactone decarboxylase family protein [Chloroflexi bacterium]|nr:carboxymuconolactone decarboxylase family protein [Chloroflexota bacterium]